MEQLITVFLWAIAMGFFIHSALTQQYKTAAAVGVFMLFAFAVNPFKGTVEPLPTIDRAIQFNEIPAKVEVLQVSYEDGQAATLAELKQQHQEIENEIHKDCEYIYNGEVLGDCATHYPQHKETEE